MVGNPVLTQKEFACASSFFLEKVAWIQSKRQIWSNA